MKRITILIASALLLCGSAFASEPAFKWYGFIRNYFAYDSRESTAGTGDLYYWMPKDVSLASDGTTDVNATGSFRFLAITSRLGVDVTGYEWNGYKMAGKIEADFYSGVSGVTGTAQLRLRQAFATVSKDNRTWKIGQAWTPMAADLPDIFSLESGVPFGMFSRSPQVTLDYKLGKTLSLTASAIAQMQYTSTGPAITKVSTDALTGISTWNYTASASANYFKYGNTPEIYLGINYKKDANVLRFGGEVVSIKPRNFDYALCTDGTYTKSEGKALARVDDRLTTWNVFQYGQTKLGNVTIKEKITYSNDGSHANLIGGYGISKINEDGSWEYTATRALSSWITFKYARKDCRWTPSLFLGYLKLFGTPEDVLSAAEAIAACGQPATKFTTSWCKNSADKLAGMYRIQPEIIYNMGKLQFGLEYMMTTAVYGKSVKNLVAEEDLHNVTNHRIQMMVKYNF